VNPPGEAPASQSPTSALSQAGLLALALRERRRVVGSWNGLAGELLNTSRLTANTQAQPRNRIELPPSFFSTWSTPIACLYGLIPDPEDMLLSLAPSGSAARLPLLAIHAC